MKKHTVVALSLLVTASLGGCKYYGSALSPEYPLSMDDALSVASDKSVGTGGTQRPIIRQTTRPRIERPSYLPEKELAIVSAPKTLLVWTYPRVTDDNTREFGSWSTIFLTDRYEWVRPSTQVPDGDDDAGQPAGRPNMGQNSPAGEIYQPKVGNLDTQGFSSGKASARTGSPTVEDIPPSSQGVTY